MADISVFSPNGTDNYNFKDSNVRIMIASEFSPSVSYAIGDYCIYNNVFYKCTTAHAAGDWDSSDFTATDVTADIKSKQNYIFRGTHDEWDNLSAAEKARYDIVAFTDDGETGDITNAVTDGDMRAITSNAVYDALNNVGGGIPTGVIVPYGGSIAPNGYLLCDGTAVSREDYADLFAVIGTSYGTGDNSTTFNVPDLRECVPVGAGQSERSSSVLKSHDTYTVGQFKDDQFQNHTHKYTRPYSGSGSMSSSGSCSTASTYDTTTYTADTTSYRAGTTTRGKRLGVNYIIKT